MHKDPKHEAERGYKQVFIKVNSLVDIDWLKATEDERKRLYVATRAVADGGNISVEEIIDAALGRKAFMGTDYISTFRRGQIRRSYAKLVHTWITENHLEIAHEIAPGLFPLPNTDTWERYLEEHAIRGDLRIVRFDGSMGLVQRPLRKPKPEEILKLGEEFCFHLNSKIEGHTVAFQEYKGKLHALPLGANEELTVAISKRETFLPFDYNGNPERLTEITDLGSHRFIFAVADVPSKLPTQMQSPDPENDVLVHVVRVQFAV